MDDLPGDDGIATQEVITAVEVFGMNIPWPWQMAIGVVCIGLALMGVGRRK